MYTVELRPGAVDLERLTTAQREARQYPHALAGYLQWLIPQWDDLAATLPERVREVRDYAMGDLRGRHLRLPGAVSLLYTGLSVALRYAVDVEALTQADADALQARAWGALVAGSLAQAERVDAERPTLRYLEVLGDLLAQGKAYLLNRRDNSKRIGGGAAGEELLGWYDDDYLYILPDASYNRVARFLRDESATLSVKKPTLAKYLLEEGLLVSDADGKTELLRVGSEVRRVWRLARHKVQETTGALSEKL